MLEPQAQQLRSTGLAAAGWATFVADCAGPSRAADGSISLPEAQWPGGIAAWNVHLHDLGLHAAFYTDYGAHGCCECPWQTNGAGSNRSFGDAGHVAVDMAQLARAGTDYIKVDSCQPVRWLAGRPDDRAQYGEFRDAIAAAASAAGRSPMVLSIVGFKGSTYMSSGTDDLSEGYGWLNQTGNSWRTGGDMGFGWHGVMGNVDAQENVPGIEQLAGPGGFNDLDMLIFGNALAGLSAADKEATHLALWAVLKSPMLLSADIAALTAAQLRALTNPRMLAVSQDALGAQATRVLPRASLRAARSSVRPARPATVWGRTNGGTWHRRQLTRARHARAARSCCATRRAGSASGSAPPPAAAASCWPTARPPPPLPGPGAPAPIALRS
jgi:alpha-galactosidase